jgi:hypothetical protein
MEGGNLVLSAPVLIYAIQQATNVVHMSIVFGFLCNCSMCLRLALMLTARLSGSYMEVTWELGQHVDEWF